jgi:hypothetical protein
VPPPYYSYYSSPPVGAIVLVVAGVTYLMAKDGSYSTKTTSSSGTVVYQSVPAPVGANIKTLPAERVLVTVSGTTYYVYSNAFYRRVMNGAQGVRHSHTTCWPAPRRWRTLKSSSSTPCTQPGGFHALPDSRRQGCSRWSIVRRRRRPQPRGASVRIGRHHRKRLLQPLPRRRPFRHRGEGAATPAPAQAVRTVAESMTIPTLLSCARPPK